MSKHIHKLTSAGDTIVEVLLAIAIVSAVLGGAYASTSRSSQGLRQSQERGEALKLAEAQLDQLKYLRSAGVQPPAVGQAFCVADTTGQMEFVDSPDPGGACKAGPDDRYEIALAQTTNPSVLEYEVVVQWGKIGGSEIERLAITYRVEK